MSGSNASSDRQPEPIAARSLRIGAVETREAIEDPFSVASRDAWAGVGDLDLDLVAVVHDLDRDLTAIGSGVPGVAEEVVEDLPDALRVAVYVNLAGRRQLNGHGRCQFLGELNGRCGQRH